MRYVVIGNSAAGVSAARAIRAADPDGSISIIGEEPYPYYGRVLTSYYLGGRVNREALFLAEEDWYRRERVEAYLGVKAWGLDVDRREVLLEDGRWLPYDRLLVATGARPQMIDVPGKDLPGVFPLRTLDHAQAIRALIRSGDPAVVVGGGLVGVKAAEGLLGAGAKVTMVVSSPQVLSQILDAEGAEMAQAALEREGVQVLLGDDVVSIEGTGRAERVILRSGKALAAKVVVVGKGVQPNRDILLATEAIGRRGIAVNQFLETAVPAVYAAGDVAETWDRAWQASRVNALWGNAVEQGRIAGANMAGASLSYPGSLAMNSLVLGDLGIIAGGMVRPPQPDQSQPELPYRVLSRKDPRRQLYRKVVLRGNQLVGVAAVGPRGESPAGVGTLLKYIGKELGSPLLEAFLLGRLSIAQWLRLPAWAD